MKEDVAIIRNFQDALGINKDLFSPELLAKNHGNAVVDVVN